jgi:hypothetical protein
LNRLLVLEESFLKMDDKALFLDFLAASCCELSVSVSG